MACLIPNEELMQSYFLYSAILVLKLLALVFMASIVENPEPMMKANLNDLKYLTPFWLLAGLFMTTSPNQTLFVVFMRIFIVARVVMALEYAMKIPTFAVKSANFVSHVITGYMGAWVILTYRSGL